MQFFSLIFRYGMLLMLGMCVGGVVTGQFALSEVLFSTAFIVIVIGGMSKFIEMLCGIVYPKFLDNKKKQKLGDLAVFLIGLLAGFGMVA